MARAVASRAASAPRLCPASHRWISSTKAGSVANSTAPAPAEVQKRGKDFFYQYPRDSAVWNLFSRLTVFAIACVCKAFVRLRHRSFVLHVDRLQAALKRAREEGRGVITVMNHVSVLDDPLVWGASLPVRTLARVHGLRWAFGARDICFKNKFESLFFSLGRVLSVQRFGRGPDQPAIDCGVYLVSRGSWVHLYPEGFVHQPYEPYAGTLRYFHWGVSRLVLESGPRAPIVLPIYAHGLHNVFPEDRVKRTFGYGWDEPLVYNYGEPLAGDRLDAFRQQWQDAEHTSGEHAGLARDAVRSDVAQFLRAGVLDAKREAVQLVAEDLDPSLGTPQFWKSQTLVKLKGLTVNQKKRKAE